MAHDSRPARPPIFNTYQETKVLSAWAKRSYLREMQELARAIAQIKPANLLAGQASIMSGLIAQQSQILNASRDLHAISAHAFANFYKVHNSWLESMRIATDFSSQLEALAKLSLAGASYQLAVTEPVLAGVDFDALRKAFSIQGLIISELETSIVDLTASYRGLTGSFTDLSEYVQLPSFVLPGATHELYTTSYALNVVQPVTHVENGITETESQFIAESEVETPELVPLLELVDPKFVPIHAGAREALNGRNADRKRHVLVSLRELCSHILRALAPNAETTKWIKQNGESNDLDESQRPTRSGRIRYILRDINSDPLNKFVDIDTRTFVKLYKLYDRLHEQEPALTDLQLRAILYRTEAYLTYIIRIWACSIHH